MDRVDVVLRELRHKQSLYQALAAYGQSAEVRLTASQQATSYGNVAGALELLNDVDHQLLTQELHGLASR